MDYTRFFYVIPITLMFTVFRLCAMDFARDCSRFPGVSPSAISQLVAKIKSAGSDYQILNNVKNNEFFEQAKKMEDDTPQQAFDNYIQLLCKEKLKYKESYTLKDFDQYPSCLFYKVNSLREHLDFEYVEKSLCAAAHHGCKEALFSLGMFYKKAGKYKQAIASWILYDKPVGYHFIAHLYDNVIPDELKSRFYYTLAGHKKCSRSFEALGAMLGARSFDAIELNRSRLYALYPYILNSIRDAHMAYMIASKEGNRDAKAYMLSLYNAMEKLDEPIQPIFKKEAFQDALTNRWPLAEEFTEYLYSLEGNDIHEEYDTSLFNPKMLTAKSSLLKKQLMEHNDRLQKHIVKLHEGAKKSDAHALIELAHRYCAGSGVECSFFKAMKLYTKALFQADEDGQKEICSVLESFYQEGSLTAAFELTLFYLSKNEFGVAIPLIRYIFSSREYLDSFSDYIESYDKGRLEGIRKQSHLAFLTLKCTERKKASVLYESKEHNDEVDYANWGMLSYLLEDYANAIIYFEKSRTLISSIFHLGKIYLHGLGLECPDKEKAYSCLETLFSPDRLHINAGAPSFYGEYEMLDCLLQHIKKQDTRARSIFIPFALLSKDISLIKDFRNVALDLLNQDLVHGNPIVESLMGVLHFKGLNFEQSNIKSLIWLEKAFTNSAATLSLKEKTACLIVQILDECGKSVIEGSISKKQLKCWYNILSFLLDRKDSVGIDHIVVLWNIAEDGTIKKFKDDLEVTKFIVTSGAYDKLCAIACKGDDNFTKMLGTMHNYRRKIGCSFINDFCKELELEIKLFEGLLKPTKEDKELLCGMYKERAAYFIHNEHYDQAIQLLEKVTNLMPKDEQTIYHLAEAYMKHRQKNVKPQKAVSKALALLTKLADSGNVDAQEALVKLYSPHMQYTPECGGTIRRNQQRSEQCLQMAASKKPSVLFSQGMLTKNTDQMVRCFESLQEHGAKTEKEKKYVACIKNLEKMPGLSRKILSCKKNGPRLEKLKKRLYEIALPQKTGLEELAKEHYLHAAIDVMRLSLILSNIEWKTGECDKMKDHVISIFRGLLLALDAGLVQNGTFSEIALDTYRDISQKLVELLIVSGLKDDEVVKSLISMINGRFQQLGVKDIRLVA